MCLILGRYPIEYRNEIVGKIMTLVQQGHSMCIVGLAGVGKSNLVHFIEQPEVSKHYLSQEEVSRTHFLSISCLPGTQPKHQIFEAMLVPAWRICTEIGADINYSPPPGSSSFHMLRNTVRTLCREHEQRLVYVFDEFESLIKYQPSDVFDNLRALRDDYRTTRDIVYVVITHRLPHLIDGKYSFGDSMLYEILRNHIFALGPYNNNDSTHMVDTLLEQGDIVGASESDRQRLIMMSGGHSSLLKAVFMEIYPDTHVSAPKILRLVDESANVRHVCERLWIHLHTDEQNALCRIVTRGRIDDAIIGFLRKRGLVSNEEPPRVFSPLFEKYIRDYRLD